MSNDGSAGQLEALYIQHIRDRLNDLVLTAVGENNTQQLWVQSVHS